MAVSKRDVAEAAVRSANRERATRTPAPRLLETTGHEHFLSRGSGRGDAIEFAASAL
jgi:hypothetical protein